jgi:hypothetical protein
VAPVRIREVKTVCERYGPGRLPGADRRTIGAGYAGAAAALGVALLSALAMAVSEFVGPPLGAGDGALGLVALAALPFVVPMAFLAGLLVWRFLPDGGTYTGLVGGLLATLGTYLGSLAVLYVLVVVLALSTGSGGIGGVLVEAGWFVGLVGIGAFTWTSWLTIPVGCASGAVYERARAA